ncbi:hypothetical protein [Lysinibacillus fusiformis]|uniref:hypothetical protein n=1 Tax=Lysinibacillus fusiformis TaxID=28031 RepID=UPI00187F8A76|nr:hypothetical protein [Lysinibacillus fusiformis]MBD8521808.1 hypothetical protein [Lysinibacillus fusiformis]
MVKIYHPTDKAYNGVRANVRFTDGVAECDIPSVIAWFEKKNFKIEDDKAKSTTRGKAKETEGE